MMAYAGRDDADRLGKRLPIRRIRKGAHAPPSRSIFLLCRLCGPVGFLKRLSVFSPSFHLLSISFPSPCRLLSISFPSPCRLQLNSPRRLTPSVTNNLYQTAPTQSPTHTRQLVFADVRARVLAAAEQEDGAHAAAQLRDALCPGSDVLYSFPGAICSSHFIQGGQVG
jgi:hypothetical protein